VNRAQKLATQGKHSGNPSDKRSTIHLISPLESIRAAFTTDPRVSRCSTWNRVVLTAVLPIVSKAISFRPIQVTKQAARALSPTSLFKLPKPGPGNSGNSGTTPVVSRASKMCHRKPPRFFWQKTQEVHILSVSRSITISTGGISFRCKCTTHLDVLVYL